MVKTNTRNINEARRAANCFDKAKRMTQEGYTLKSVSGGENLYLCIAPDGITSYGVDTEFSRCNCPDYVKHHNGTGGYCKHLLWVEMQVSETKSLFDEAAAMEAAASEHDAQRERLQEVLIDALLPEPYASSTTLTMNEQATLDRFRARLIDELRTVQHRILNTDPFDKAAQGWRRRADRTADALNVFDYLLFQMQTGHLSLDGQAQETEKFDSGYECGKDLAAERI